MFVPNPQICSQTTVRLVDSSDEDVIATKSNCTNGSKTNSKKSAKNLLIIRSDESSSEAEVDRTSDKDKDGEEIHVRST